MTHSARIIRGKLSLSVILFALCCVFSARADDAQTASKVAASVELLGDEQSKVRNKAYATLERMLEDDEKIAAHLQPFKNHEDPEIVARIRGLLQKKQNKILAEERKKKQQLELKNKHAKDRLEFQKQIAKLRVLEKKADGVWRIDPDDEKMMRSINKKKSIHKIKLTFVNQSKQPVKIFTICAHKHKDEGGGSRNKHTKIEPGKTHNFKETWEQRVYVLTDMDDKALGLYLTGEKNAKIEFKGVPAAKK